MKKALKLFLRAQTVLGLIPFVVLVIQDCVLIDVRLSTYDIEAFSCFPSLNASTKQRCYDAYSSGLLFYMVLMHDGIFCLYWIFVIVKTTLDLRQIKRSRQIENDESEQSVNPRLNWLSAKFVKKSRVCLGCFVGHAGVMIILLTYLYVSDNGFIVSSMYKCSLQVTNTTSIPTNHTKTDFYCYDQNFKEKINLNIATAVIRFFIWILLMISFIFVLKTPTDKLMDTLLGDVMEERESNLQEMRRPSGDYFDLRSLSFRTLYRDAEESGSIRELQQTTTVTPTIISSPMKQMV